MQPVAFGINAFTHGMASAANGWLLLVDNGRNTQSIRVTRSGQVMPPSDVFLQTGGGDKGLTSNGANFLAATGDGPNGVRLALLDANGQVTATGKVDVNSYFVAVSAARRDFLLATREINDVSFWRIGAYLRNPHCASRG